MQCLVGVSHEIGRGAQGASLMVPGKSGLHVRGEGPKGYMPTLKASSIQEQQAAVEDSPC